MRYRAHPRRARGAAGRAGVSAAESFGEWLLRLAAAADPVREHASTKRALVAQITAIFEESRGHMAARV